MKVLNQEQWNLALKEVQHPFQASYFAMYSSYVGGVVLNPNLMMVPIDDHLVHRGDGVFEAIKVIDRGIYLLEAHLNRLLESAKRISLDSQYKMEQIKDLIIKTLELVKENNSLIRLYFSRGPGGFTTNPYDSIGAQLYIVISRLSQVPAEKYLTGVKVGRSEVPVKSGWMPQVKSCNYLHNVLMKKEAVDRGLDFTIGFDESGFLTESSTENFILIDQKGELVFPNLDKILKGTTMIRFFDLVEKSGMLKVRRSEKLSEQDLLKCKGAFLIGTTIDLLPVSQYESTPIPLHELNSKLISLLKSDQMAGSPVVETY